MARLVLASLAAIVGLLGAMSAADAQPTLVSSTPAAKSTGNSVTSIKLNFSEPIVAGVSGVDLVMTAMPGMTSHNPMPIRGFKMSINDKSISIVLPRKLPAGSYRLSWRAAGRDNQVSRAQYDFTVK